MVVSFFKKIGDETSIFFLCTQLSPIPIQPSKKRHRFLSPGHATTSPGIPESVGEDDAAAVLNGRPQIFQTHLGKMKRCATIRYNKAISIYKVI